MRPAEEGGRKDFDPLGGKRRRKSVLRSSVKEEKGFRRLRVRLKREKKANMESSQLRKREGAAQPTGVPAAVLDLVGKLTEEKKKILGARSLRIVRRRGRGEKEALHHNGIAEPPKKKKDAVFAAR